MLHQVEHLELEADKAIKGGPLVAARKIPTLLGEVFGLLRAIINRLPEDPTHGT